MPSSAPLYIEGFRPGYLGRIAQIHGEYYARVWGSGVEFEALQARELCEFFERYDPDRDLLVTAHVDNVIAGSVAIDGTQPERPGLARLRWFLVDEGYQGMGIGRALLDRAMEFCRKIGFSVVYLRTVEGLPRSLQMYQDLGFRIVERAVGTHYSIELTHPMLELPLRSDQAQ